jgi:pyridoxine 5-phosphate synthase
MTDKKLNINIDHIATIRNARGGASPDIIRSLKIIKDSGADGVTIHLREDRRHIKDIDVLAIKLKNILPLNFEMAPTNAMLAIALKISPKSVCLVPEKREELTTEGGLNIITNKSNISNIISKLQNNNIACSLFIEPEKNQILAAKDIGADIIEIHTGKYCNLVEKYGFDHQNCLIEFEKIKKSAKLVVDLGMECHGGHGINFLTITEIAKIEQILTLHIGHFAISEAIFIGLGDVTRKLKDLITDLTQN